LELTSLIRPAGRNRAPQSPLLLWNHRWEYDKDPDAFFHALFDLANENLPFRLAVTGESYRRQPAIFEEARIKLADRIVHFGYCADRKAYVDILQRADILPVTARQDFFGISVVEAIAAGVTPLLPDDMVYREHVADSDAFYPRTDFVTRLRGLISGWPPGCANKHSNDVLCYDWSQQAPAYDLAFTEVRRMGESK
jgi:glycosyltransferase involved in cell wall biosynthesis